MKFGVHIDEYMENMTAEEVVERVKRNKEIIDEIIRGD